jgi:hypothetical protein
MSCNMFFIRSWVNGRDCTSNKWAVKQQEADNEQQTGHVMASNAVSCSMAEPDT